MQGHVNKKSPKMSSIIIILHKTMIREACQECQYKIGKFNVTGNNLFRAFTFFIKKKKSFYFLILQLKNIFTLVEA